MLNIDKKIEELEQLRAIHSKVKNIIPENLWSEDVLGIMQGIVRKDKIRVYTECKSLSMLSIWLISLPTEEKESKIGFSGKDPITVPSPYLIGVSNPCVRGSVTYPTITISWVHGELYLEVSIAADLLKDCLTQELRKITSSEYHYFTGVSQRKLNEMNVNSYAFRTPNQARFYGGSRKLYDLRQIDSILNYISAE